MNSNGGDSRNGQRVLPDMRGAGQGRAERDDNPLSGRRGLEGNAAAFDMKSLDKHLEAVSGRPLLLMRTRSRYCFATQSPSATDHQGNGLTDREEMETSLIRALISSYFSIVRQTIQDLVPKSIMRAPPPSPSLLRRIAAQR